MDAPPPLDLPLLHTRRYDVDSYRDGPDRIRLRGSVRDQKPPGLYVADDPDPLTIHHMVVDLTVEMDGMEIVAAEVVFETHPHDTCPTVTDHYRHLVGLSIARGFTHRVRELFGGPRGCTHTTALLQAMAPVAIQSIWSARGAAGTGSEAGAEPVAPPRRLDPDERWERFRFNLNTCHVWAEDGAMVARAKAGEEIPAPRWIVDRLDSLGRDVDEWRSRMGS